MKLFKRLFLKNFWYELNLNLTIWNTIKKTGKFTEQDILRIKERYNVLKVMNKNMILDIQSEFHLAWVAIMQAFYECFLNKGYSIENSLTLTAEIIFSNLKADSLSEYVKRSLNKSKDPFGYMVNSSKKQEKDFFGITFKFSRLKDDDNSYHLLVNECFYFNYFTKNKVPELMQIACKWDLISWAPGIIPEKHGFTFNRPATLGLDNKKCEFNLDKIKK
jgi:hypothetical protein